jgi:hypothetical protein
MPPRGTIEPDFARIGAGASDMRVVAGTLLTGGRSRAVSSRRIGGEKLGGAFAAGATPVIVFFSFRRSDSNAAPMRKLK